MGPDRTRARFLSGINMNEPIILTEHFMEMLLISGANLNISVMLGWYDNRIIPIFIPRGWYDNRNIPIFTTKMGDANRNIPIII